MSEAANQIQHDFWRPPVQASTGLANGLVNPERSSACRHCGTEFIVSSLYCHACGSKRPNLNAARSLEIPGRTELASLAGHMGLTMPAVVAFLLGMLCMLGALSVSAFFSARTTLDWQAIQLWRIEWLLAAVAAFAAGCLLKK